MAFSSSLLRQPRPGYNYQSADNFPSQFNVQYKNKYTNYRGKGDPWVIPNPDGNEMELTSLLPLAAAALTKVNAPVGAGGAPFPPPYNGPFMPTGAPTQGIGPNTQIQRQLGAYAGMDVAGAGANSNASFANNMNEDQANRINRWIKMSAEGTRWVGGVNPFAPVYGANPPPSFAGYGVVTDTEEAPIAPLFASAVSAGSNLPSNAGSIHPNSLIVPSTYTNSTQPRDVPGSAANTAADIVMKQPENSHPFQIIAAGQPAAQDPNMPTQDGQNIPPNPSPPGVASSQAVPPPGGSSVAPSAPSQGAQSASTSTPQPAHVLMTITAFDRLYSQAEQTLQQFKSGNMTQGQLEEYLQGFFTQIQSATETTDQLEQLQTLMNQFSSAETKSTPQQPVLHSGSGAASSSPPTGTQVQPAAGSSTATASTASAGSPDPRTPGPSATDTSIVREVESKFDNVIKSLSELAPHVKNSDKAAVVRSWMKTVASNQKLDDTVKEMLHKYMVSKAESIGITFNE